MAERRKQHETSKQHAGICQPLGIYSGFGGFRRWHGQCVGLSPQAGQQRRRRVFADLSAVYRDFQLCWTSGGICHGTPRRNRYAGCLSQRLGHPREKGRQSRQCFGLAAAGGLALHRHWLRRNCYLHAESAGGFRDRHAAVGRCRLVVRVLFRAAVFGGSLSHHRGGGHAAHAVFGCQKY